MTVTRSSPFLLILVGLLVLSVLLIPLAQEAAVYAPSSHALQRRGWKAEVVNNCLNNNGPMMTFQHDKNGRKALLCQLPNGLYGVKIEPGPKDTVFEGTDIIKEKLSEFWKVLRYLQNRGYNVSDELIEFAKLNL